MTADRPEKSVASASVVVDESLISPKGWMMLESLAYLKDVRSGKATAKTSAPGSSTAASIGDDILDLAARDTSIVRLSRRDNDNRAGLAEGRRRIPPGDIVAVGGTNLRPRSAEQPFEDAPEVANDNLGRVLLLVVLLIAVVGGYALTSFGPDNRRAIEVAPPDSPQMKVTWSGRASSFAGTA